ncbi:MAG: CotH kinase family protein [Bacteroidia bacterium]
MLNNLTRLLFVAFLSLTAIPSYSQQFVGVGGSIPDDGTSIRFNLPVSGLPSSLDSTFGLKAVSVNIVHTYDSDLEIFLIAPDSTYIELSTGNGGGGNNYINTFFVDTVPSFITNGSAPFSGSFRPESPLYSVNNGLDPNQTWQLLIHDNYPFADAGILLNWALYFGANPPQGLMLQSSNLPIVKISTMGQVIPDDPKITATMKIIDNGAGIRNYVSDTVFAYNGYIGIEVRGSSSQMFPKKSFGVETRDSLGTDLDVSLFGMPAESDWVLNANFTDKTLMRNVISYDLSRSMGHYASRIQYCELLVNGQYQGVYIFMEKIKRDPGRVDIAKLTPADTSGDDLTGGYILKIDKPTGTSGPGFSSAYPPPNGGPTPNIQFEYPDYATILPVQANYIQQFVDSMEQALHGPNFSDPLTGYRNYIDINSWIDYFIINELAKNVDGYRISTFFHKPKDSDGRLMRMGPVWDYDIAWGNADYYGGDSPSGYSYIFPSTSDGNQVPFWWNRLMQDPYFKNNLRCRWDSLRSNLLSDASLNAWIDSVGALLDESQARNFTQWPILGVYVWPNPQPFPPDYAGVKQELKNWITARAGWLDTFLPGTCSLAGLDNTALLANGTVYPNPAGDDTWLLFPDDQFRRGVLHVYDAAGKLLSSQGISIQHGRHPLDLRAYDAGLIIVEFVTEKETTRFKLVKR